MRSTSPGLCRHGPRAGEGGRLGVRQYQAGFSADVASLQQWMQNKRSRTWQGHPNALLQTRDASLITMYTSTNVEVGSTAGRDMVSWIQDSAAVDGSIAAAATQEDSAFGRITEAGAAAAVANFMGKDADRLQALSTARTAANALGAAVDAFWLAHGQTQALGGRLEQLRIELNRLVPVNASYNEHIPGGMTYWSPSDARFAAATFSAYAKALQHAADRKIILDELLARSRSPRAIRVSIWAVTVRTWR